MKIVTVFHAVVCRYLKARLPLREFTVSRPYCYGEDARSIDWQATARTGGLIARRRMRQKSPEVIVLRISQPARHTSFLSWLRFGLLAASLVMLVFSMTHPHIVSKHAIAGLHVVVCIDTSGSMASHDIVPTRARAAIMAIQSLITELPPGTHVSYVAFSTRAAPAQLDTLPFPDGQTAIGDALALAGNELTGPHSAIVLVTDGVNNTGRDPLFVARELAIRHIPIYAAGIGSIHGDVMAGTSERATIDTGALKTYTQITGGQTITAQSAQALLHALEYFGNAIGYTGQKIDISYPIALTGGFLGILRGICKRAITSSTL